MDAAAAAAAPPLQDSEVEELQAMLEEAAEESLLPLDEVFATVLAGVMDGSFCACHVMDIVTASWKGVLKQHDPKAPRAKRLLAEKLTRLGLMTLELAQQTSLLWQASACRKWSRVLFAATAFVNHWVPGLFPSRPRQTAGLKLWVATVMTSPQLCPDRLLRLELLHFVSMWHPMDLVKDNQLCRRMGVAVFLNLLNLTVKLLLPGSRAGLLYPLGNVLFDLHNADFLQLLTVRSANNVRLLQVSHTERALAHVVLLMGQAAYRLLHLRRRKVLSLRATLDEFDTLLQVLRLLVATPPHQALYEAPGMCQIAAGAIAAVARCIVRVPDADAFKYEAFQSLLVDLDNFFLILANYQETGAVKQELRRHHGRCLAHVAPRMQKLGCPVLFMPIREPKPTVQPPKDFLDSHNGRLMEDPVRLEASGRVVDRSTLMVLLLVDYKDRDLTFTPLPELREAIQAWQRGGGVTQDTETQEQEGEGDAPV